MIMPYVWDGQDNATRVNETRHGIKMQKQLKEEELLNNIKETIAILKLVEIYQKVQN